MVAWQTPSLILSTVKFSMACHKQQICHTTFTSLFNKTICDKHCLKNLAPQLTFFIAGLEEYHEIPE